MKLFKKKPSYRELEADIKWEHNYRLSVERDCSITRVCFYKLYQMVEEAQDLQTLKSTAQKLMERFCEANGTVYWADYVQRAEDEYWRKVWGKASKSNDGNDDSGDAGCKSDDTYNK